MSCEISAKGFERFFKFAGWITNGQMFSMYCSLDYEKKNITFVNTQY